MWAVHHTSFLQQFSCRRGDGRLASLNNELATIITQQVNFDVADILHGTTGDTDVTGDIKQILRMVKFGTRRTDDVPSQQGTTFRLDLVDGCQLTLGDTGGFVNMSTGVCHGNGDGTVIQQLFCDGSCPLSGTDNHYTLTLQGITFIFQHPSGKMDDSETRYL